MITAGLGDRRLPLVVHCRDCVTAGQMQVRPPVPARNSQMGWSSSVYHA
jgi:hypothetical protein